MKNSKIIYLFLSLSIFGSTYKIVSMNKPLKLEQEPTVNLTSILQETRMQICLCSQSIQHYSNPKTIKLFNEYQRYQQATFSLPFLIQQEKIILTILDNRR